MAKKTRTPPPPRPVQAPRQRAGASPDGERRTRLFLYAFAASGLVALGAVIAFLTLAGRGSASPREALQAAGCTLQEYPASRGGIHVERPPKRGSYNSFPPTSGPHHPTPAPFDVYGEPVEQYRLVHNLEHGGVVIQYGSRVARSDVDALTEWYREDPNGIVIAPLPALGRTVALTAWTAEPEQAGERAKPGTGYLAKCTRFDEDAFSAFADEYRFRGPERIPPELLTPGS